MPAFQNIYLDAAIENHGAYYALDNKKNCYKVLEIVIYNVYFCFVITVLVFY